MFKKIKDRIKELFNKIREKIKQIIKEVTERFREKEYVIYLEKLKKTMKDDPGLGNVKIMVTDYNQLEAEDIDPTDLLELLVVSAKQLAQANEIKKQGLDELDDLPIPNSLRDQAKEELSQQFEQAIQQGSDEIENIVTWCDNMEDALNNDSLNTQMSLKSVVNGGYEYIMKNINKTSYRLNYLESRLDATLDRCERILKDYDTVDPRLLKMINQSASCMMRQNKLFLRALQKVTSQLINGTKKAVQEYRQNNSNIAAANATRTSITNESVYDERLAWLLQ